MTEADKEDLRWSIKAGKDLLDALLEHGVRIHTGAVVIQLDALTRLRDRFDAIDYTLTYGRDGNGPLGA